MSAGRPAQSPTEQELLALLARLNQEQRYPETIQLTEAWAATVDRLPLTAGLAAARAFLALRLVDRAWERLREQTEATEHVDLQLLMAEAYIERGWPARAVDVLARVRAAAPDHPALVALAPRAAAPPLRLPANVRDIERDNDPEQLLFLAERYMAAGSLLRARSLLERLRRQHPADTRIQDLLWAARDDLRAPQGDLAALYRAIAALGGAAEDADDSGSEWEAAEHTESVLLSRSAAAALGRLSKAASPTGGFPHLFRHEQDDLPQAEEAEVTMAAIMASREELLEPPTEELTDAGYLTGDEPDTRIMEVISNERGERRLVSVAGAPAPAPAPSGPRTLDLRSLASESADPDTEQLDLEGEQERVELTRLPTGTPPRSSGAAGPKTLRRKPIEVVEKHPTPIRPASAAESTDPSVEAPAPTTVPQAPAVPPPPAVVSAPVSAPPAPDEEDALAGWPARGRGTTMPLLLAAGVSMLAVVLAGGIYLSMQARAADQLEQQLSVALASGSFPALRELEAVLTEQVRSEQPPLAARASALALVEAVLWDEYTGSLEDRQQAEDALKIAQDAGASPQETALAAGHLALVAGDTAAVAAQAAAAGLQPETQYLLARARLEAGGAPAAVGAELWASPPAGERYAALTYRLSGEHTAPAADAPLEEQVIALEQGWPPREAGEQQRAIEALLAAARQDLSPRQRGRLLATLARLHAASGREAAAQRAWQQALEADPSQPEALAAAASWALATGTPQAALELVDRCRSVRPPDARCRRLQVMALLELDRLDTARTAAQGLPVLEAWVALAAGDPAAAHAMLAPKLVDLAGVDGLTLYVAGQAQAAQGAEADAEAWLSEARTRLTEGDPAEQMLAHRASAALLVSGSSAAAARRAAALRELGAVDPVVHLQLAEYYTRIRRSAEAGQHLARAAELAQNSAIALFALGQQQERQRAELWGRYLALQPEGRHAEEARQEIGAAASVPGK